MAAVIIIGLIVAVLALGFIAIEQARTITKYEHELINIAKKGKKK